MGNQNSDFMDSILNITSYLLGAEAIVLSIVYVGVAQGSFLKGNIVIGVSSVLLIGSILASVLVLTGSINYKINQNQRWLNLARTGSNFTVWLFLLALFGLAVGILEKVA